MVPRPAFSQFRFGDAKLQAGCARTFKMAVEGGAGEHGPMDVLEKPVNGCVGAPGLLLFELYGGRQDFGWGRSGMTAVLAILSCQGLESPCTILVELSPESGKGGLPHATAGKDHLLLRELS